MSNPWMDPDKAGAWRPTGKPGQAHREPALAVVFRLLDVHAPRCIVDLGCGIGDIDARLLERYPAAVLTAIDGAPGMVERSRAALAPYGARARVLQSELEAPWHGEVATPVDVVFASQVVHHLATPAKRDLFARVHALLEAGGLFVLSDKVRFDARFFPHHVALWNATRAELGLEPRPQATFETYTAEERAGGDVPDGLAEQLLWLREAGFAAAEPFWQHGEKVVIAAIKAAASS